jgi:nitrogenase molybdenum-iron protein alpha/beta subunit
MIVDHQDLLARPDGFVGSILAAEGITDACAILNGPTGCKFHLGEIAKDQYRRENDTSVMRWAEEFYFGQDRLPCTYLDDYDYVFGTAEKLEYVFGRVAEKGYSFLAVLNSPGASLIGDDLQRYVDWAGLKIPALVIEKPLFTEQFEAGWNEAAARIVECLAPQEQPVEPRTVNLVGLSIWQRHWQGSRAELERLLSLCGIRVHAVLLAGCSVAQIQTLRRAACNVIVHEELGGELAAFLSSRFDMPMVRCDDGAPVGFAATESWIRQVCAAVEADPAPALEDIARHRKTAAEKISRFVHKTGMPRGTGFGLQLEASLALPLTRWLCEYLAMTPVAIQVPDEAHPLAVRLKAYLESIGAGSRWNAPMLPDSPPEVIVSNDAVILRVTSKADTPVGIDLAMPAKDVMHFVGRSVLGAWGTLWILESLCNGLWKPPRIANI